MTRYDKPAKMAPNANLYTALGLCLPNLVHKLAKTGANIIINTGLIDWNQAAGMWKSNAPLVNLAKLSSVFWSAKLAKTVEPCS